MTSKLTELVKGNKKTFAAGGIVSVLAALMMTLSGCYATYHHKVVAGEKIQLEESYRIEFKKDK